MYLKTRYEMTRPPHSRENLKRTGALQLHLIICLFNILTGKMLGHQTYKLSCSYPVNVLSEKATCSLYICSNPVKYPKDKKINDASYVSTICYVNKQNLK